MFDVVCFVVMTYLTTCYADSSNHCMPYSKTNRGGFILWTHQEFRSTGSVLGRHDEAICDRYIDEWWYRIQSLAGEKMPDSCVTTKFGCSTHYPIWLNGRHPAVWDGVVTRPVCIAKVGQYESSDNCCEVTYNIELQNCRDFYVYKLKPTPGCNMGYCFGGESKCPEGQTSETGYTPNCKEPIRETCREADVSVGESADKTEIEFYCDFHCEELYERSAVEVEWYIGDEFVATELVTEGSTSVLREKDWCGIHKLGQEVSCRVKTVVPGKEVVGDPVESEGYFAGIKILTKEIEVKEGEEADIEFQLTVPFLCKEHQRPYCILPVEVHVPENQDKTAPKCGYTMEEMPQLKVTECGIQVTPYSQGDVINGNPNTLKIKVIGVGDYTYDGKRKRIVQLKTSDVNPFHKCWSDIDIGQVEVTITDTDHEVKNTVCYSHNDPHMKTFDNSFYENHIPGEFVLYEHTELPIRVHTFYQSCNRRKATCNCGVAVQAGNDVVIIDRCKNSKSRNPQRLRLSVSGCEEFGKGLKIVETSHGYELHLPNGSIVKVIGRRGHFFNVQVIPSSGDFNKTRGLCGTWNADCRDDFLKQDGNTDFISWNSCKNKRKYPNSFSKSWRITDPDKSLYSGKPYPWPEHRTPFKKTHYCTCGEKEGDHVVECGQSAYSECSGGDELTQLYKHKCESRKRRDVKASEDDDDDDDVLFLVEDNEFEILDWPTPNGWTEDQAIEYCSNHIQQTDVGKACSASVPGVSTDGAMDECIQDILLADGPSFANSTLETFVSGCRDEMMRNISIWEENESGQMSPPMFLLDRTCPQNCNDNGVCSLGTCVCHEGFLGSDCSLKITETPVIYGLARDGICDIKNKACLSVAVYGDNFIKSSKLTCHITRIQASSDNSTTRGLTIVSNATYEYSGQIRCHLPQRSKDVPYEEFYVTASNDGLNAGTEFYYGRYHSDCSLCNGTTNSCMVTGDPCTVNSSRHISLSNGLLISSIIFYVILRML